MHVGLWYRKAQPPKIRGGESIKVLAEMHKVTAVGSIVARAKYARMDGQLGLKTGTQALNNIVEK